jgi:hypothetical protein
LSSFIILIRQQSVNHSDKEKGAAGDLLLLTAGFKLVTIELPGVSTFDNSPAMQVVAE